MEFLSVIEICNGHSLSLIAHRNCCSSRGSASALAGFAFLVKVIPFQSVIRPLFRSFRLCFCTSIATCPSSDCSLPLISRQRTPMRNFPFPPPFCAEMMCSKKIIHNLMVVRLWILSPVFSSHDLTSPLANNCDKRPRLRDQRL